jgi:ATP-dependent exoDNAse (exonuclease V) beta subunit
VLAHPLLHDARQAEARGACRREVPVTLTLESGLLLEGVVDLAFERNGVWTVVDFKTDEDPTAALEAYRRQVGLYASAIGRVASDHGAGRQPERDTGLQPERGTELESGRGAGRQPCETPRGFVLMV